MTRAPTSCIWRAVARSAAPNSCSMRETRACRVAASAGTFIAVSVAASTSPCASWACASRVVVMARDRTKWGRKADRQRWAWNSAAG